MFKQVTKIVLAKFGHGDLFYHFYRFLRVIDIQNSQEEKNMWVGNPQKPEWNCGRLQEFAKEEEPRIAAVVALPESEAMQLLNGETFVSSPLAETSDYCRHLSTSWMLSSVL